MVNFPDLIEGINLLFSWKMPIAIFFGMILGLIIGVIPGMTAALGLAIILPLTLSMDALTALILMTSVYTGSLTGGGILAILINTPGTPGAVATTFDGYPMTRAGFHNEALGMQISSSVIGGILSYIVLLFAIEPMTWLALKFGSSEMLALTIFVIIFIGILQGKYLSRSIFAGIFGILVSNIGTSVSTGVARGTFGFAELEDGLPLIICIIGMFAIPELLSLVNRKSISDGNINKKNKIEDLFKGIKKSIKRYKIWLSGSLVGIFVGVLPAAGATIASLSSYSLAKKFSKNKKNFGKGEPDGIISAESANNASEGGAMAILLSLGIPGSASTAVILGGFMLHGLVPGGGLFRDNGPLVYGLIVGNIFQMIFLGFFAAFIAFYVGKIVKVKSYILIPFLIILMSVGSFAYRSSIFDIFILYIFGIIGWYLKKFDFTPLSFMIGLFLGRQIDEDIERVIILFSDNPLKVFESGITLTISILTVISLIYYFFLKIKNENNKN
tara:strand:- start:1315 stop:2814 length:1500 start_codon:yes stop_codon:yes gene_type:complete